MLMAFIDTPIIYGIIFLLKDKSQYTKNENFNHRSFIVDLQKFIRGKNE